MPSPPSSIQTGVPVVCGLCSYSSSSTPLRISINFLKLASVLLPMEPGRVCCNPGWKIILLISLGIILFIWMLHGWWFLFQQRSLDLGRDIYVGTGIGPPALFVGCPPPCLPAYGVGCDICSLAQECQRVVWMPGIIFKVISLAFYFCSKLGWQPAKAH